jgi:protein TonB
MRMALRALLFSSDGTSTSTLCQVLTELGIEAEICPEMLVAVQRISHESYDAILVDWDQEADAISLLKTVRERKVASQALNLALVKHDKDLPRALQHGANSVIRKPIDPRQAKDTLSTARDLILSRRSEQKTKEERTAAAQAAIAAAAAELQDEVEPPAPKSGFVAQTAPRSAMEAEESTQNRISPSEPAPWQAAQPPAKRHEPEIQPQESQPVNQSRWHEKPQIEESPSVEITPREAHTSEDATGVFSSLPEEVEPQPEPEKQSHPRYFVFAAVACFLIAAVLWVGAPGGSYQGLLNSVLHAFTRAPHSAASQPVSTASPVQSVSLEQPAPPSAPPPSAPEEQLVPTDPGPVESSEVDPSKLEVIETKAIPKPGAQQPAQAETAAGSDQEPSQAVPATPKDVSAPTVQPPAQVQPTVVPVAKPQTPVVVPVQQKAVPPSAGRTGVIIPDSLKTTPSQTPANSLDSGVVPEETSRGLVDHRVEPDYPAQALPQHLEGPVVLQVWVAKDGTVQDVKLVRGYFALARAASDAVRQWRFKPYSPNGKAIDFQTIVTVNFKYPG